MLYILVGILLGLLAFKLFKSAKYWEDRDVPFEPALPIIGNMGSAVLKKQHLMDVLLDLYKKNSHQRYVGIMQFTRPMLLINDIELIKDITVKDFEHFHDHAAFGTNDKDPIMSRSLMTLHGLDWKQMRDTLSPVFTSSKMRTMFQLMSECAEAFVGHFKGKEQVAINAKEVFTRFATDVIASTAFGIKINSLEDSKNSFFRASQKLERGVLQFAKTIILSKLPFLSKLLGVRMVPDDVTRFFRSIVKDNIEKRENEGNVRPDLIHLLMEARKGRLTHDLDQSKDEGFATVEEYNTGKVNTKNVELTDDDILAQAMLFFFAGFHTVSTVSCFVAYELAVYPDIQERLQKEIDAVREDDEKISYKMLLSMKYLDQVISETLRLWPAGFQTDRICTKNYTIQPQRSNEREVLIEKGISVLIPIAGIHRDSRYYPDPEKFDPERFSDENKSKILPGTYLPFGAGPRNCIGSRFALLEIKTLFFFLLSRFDIVPVTGTEIPLHLTPNSTSLEPKTGFRLGFKPRKV